LGEHLLADAGDGFADTGEAETALRFQYLEDEHGPLVGDAANDVVDESFDLGIEFFIRGRWLVE
jgi:hypothetical protein